MAQHRIAREAGIRPDTFFFHIEDGYHYHQSHVREGTVYYKCVKYNPCRGRATYDIVDGFVHTQPHNHDPDFVYADEMALRRCILRRCDDLEYVTYHRIIFEEGRRFGPEAVARVTYCRMKTPMRIARLRRFPNPPPATLEELTVILQNCQYEVMTMTDDGLDNIYGGSVTDPDGFHHILFMSDRMLERARAFRVFHADGTFRVVPSGNGFADQVFCIVGVWNHHIVSLAWVLMTRRTQVAYTAVLQLLQNYLGPEIELTRIITDFETAQQNAWHNVFNVNVQGCLWHFCRAFIQQAAILNLINRIRRMQEVRRIVRLTMGLPLLPEHLIVDGFRVIMDHARNEGNYIFRIVRPFLIYVWRHWVSRPWRRERMSVFGSQQRTNNACESHNRCLREEVGTHPNIYHFIAGLVRLEQRSHNIILSLEEGRRVSRGRRRISILNDRRVQLLSDELLNPPGPMGATIFRFLSAVSHTLDHVVDELLRDLPQGRP